MLNSPCLQKVGERARNTLSRVDPAYTAGLEGGVDGWEPATAPSTGFFSSSGLRDRGRIGATLNCTSRSLFRPNFAFMIARSCCAASLPRTTANLSCCVVSCANAFSSICRDFSVSISVSEAPTACRSFSTSSFTSGLRSTASPSSLKSVTTSACELMLPMASSSRRLRREAALLRSPARRLIDRDGDLHPPDVDHHPFLLAHRQLEDRRHRRLARLRDALRRLHPLGLQLDHQRRLLHRQLLLHPLRLQLLPIVLLRVHAASPFGSSG